jgi:hypothetical protein
MAINNEHEEGQECGHEESENLISADDAIKIGSEDVIEMLDTAGHVMGRIHRTIMMYNGKTSPVQMQAIKTSLEKINTIVTFIDDISEK